MGGVTQIQRLVVLKQVVDVSFVLMLLNTQQWYLQGNIKVFASRQAARVQLWFVFERTI